MFGFYRTFLAFTVVLLHLYGLPRYGNYAVFSFFILSGFLMTTIMQDQYGYSKQGRIKFALNRALRLYPMYLYAAVISIILILIVGAEIINYNNRLYLPSDIVGIVSNLTMIFPNMIPHRFEPILSPATWAITIELFYYMLICLGISKTKKHVMVWLAVSVLYFCYAYYTKTATWRYSAIPAGSLPFALGSFLYFIKQDLFDFLKRLKLDSPYLWLVLFILNAFLANSFSKNGLFGEISIFINLIAGLILTCILFYQGFSFLDKKIDASLGEYSYPFYLLHYQAGAIVTFFIFQGETIAATNPKETSFWAVPILVGLSFIGIHLIDRRVTLLRQKVKA